MADNTLTFVVNASPLISLERIGQLTLLPQLLPLIYMPTAVRQEVFGPRPYPTWLIERPITQPLSSFIMSPRLGPGEREAIVLAIELQPCHVILDDLAARRTALSMNLTVVGTVGLLITARQRHLLPALKPHLDQLRQVDFHIAEALYTFALQQVGEA